MNLKFLFQGRTYENQVIVIICLLAVARVVVAVGEDLVNPGIQLTEVLMDAGILLVFASVFAMVIFNRTVSSFHPVVGVVIIMLIGLNFIQFGGVMGATRFTYLAGIFFIGMAYSNRNLFIMVGIQYLLLIVMLEMQIVRHPIREYLFSRNAAGITDFIFALCSMTVMASFLRETTRNEFLRMRELSIKLNEDVKRSLAQNRELVEQGEVLLHAQERLAAEVRTRTEKIQIQNSAIEQFIKYNTEALIEPQAKLKQVIEAFQGDSELHQFLQVSGEELTEVVNSIRETILSEENLNRKKIRPYE